MAKINVELVTPEALVLSAPAQMVTLPGTEGDFGVLKGHAPMISSLRPGVIRIAQDAKEGAKNLFVSGGFVEVTAERCTVLAEEATDLANITTDVAKKRLQEAQDALTYAPDSADKRALAKKIDLAKTLVAVVEAL